MQSFFEAMYRIRTKTGVAVNPQPVAGSLNRLKRDDVLDERLRYEVGFTGTWPLPLLVLKSNITRASPPFALL